MSTPSAAVPPHGGGLAIGLDGALALMPRDLTHACSGDLINVLTLLRAARDALELPEEEDGNGITSVHARRTALIFMAEERLCKVLGDMSPYV